MYVVPLIFCRGPVACNSCTEWESSHLYFTYYYLRVMSQPATLSSSFYFAFSVVSKTVISLVYAKPLT